MGGKLGGKCCSGSVHVTLHLSMGHSQSRYRPRFGQGLPAVSCRGGDRGMRGMVAQMLEVGPCIRALGDAAGSAIPVLHIIGYPGGACHCAPVLLKPALLERLSRPRVDDHRPEALIRWYA